jgi:hypothetical protein
VTVVAPEVASIIEREMIAIVGAEIVEMERASAGSVLSKLAFPIESFMEQSSPRVQIEELTHKLNHLREVTLKEKLLVERNNLKQLEQAGDPDTVVVLQRVLELQKQLQVAAYTPELFGFKK